MRGSCTPPMARCACGMRAVTSVETGRGSPAIDVVLVFGAHAYDHFMRYRRLGKTDLRVSVVGVGTWQFGGEWGKDFSQDEVGRMLARAGELGINLIDTAECYGDHLSESLIGNAIRGQ